MVEDVDTGGDIASPRGIVGDWQNQVLYWTDTSTSVAAMVTVVSSILFTRQFVGCSAELLWLNEKTFRMSDWS